jgi:hypothetical protein
MAWLHLLPACWQGGIHMHFYGMRLAYVLALTFCFGMIAALFLSCMDLRVGQGRRGVLPFVWYLRPMGLKHTLGSCNMCGPVYPRPLCAGCHVGGLQVSRCWWLGTHLPALLAHCMAILFNSIALRHAVNACLLRQIQADPNNYSYPCTCGLSYVVYVVGFGLTAACAVEGLRLQRAECGCLICSACSPLQVSTQHPLKCAAAGKGRILRTSLVGRGYKAMCVYVHVGALLIALPAYTSCQPSV